jgi:phage terminase Nu1 subunit (DNA packaging protein)
MKLTKIDLAEVFGVHTLVVDAWRERGMPAETPVSGPNGDNGDDQNRWTVSRRELAKLWDVHPDTLSRWLPEGLGAAVLERRGKNEPMFDVRLAWRWKLARDNRLCEVVLEDFKACVDGGIAAVHLLTPIYAFMRDESAPSDVKPAKRKARK